MTDTSIALPEFDFTNSNYAESSFAATIIDASGKQIEGFSHGDDLNTLCRSMAFSSASCDGSTLANTENVNDKTFRLNYDKTSIVVFGKSNLTEPQKIEIRTALPGNQDYNDLLGNELNSQ